MTCVTYGSTTGGVSGNASSARPPVYKHPEGRVVARIVGSTTWSWTGPTIPAVNVCIRTAAGGFGRTAKFERVSLLLVVISPCEPPRNTSKWYAPTPNPPLPSAAHTMMYPTPLPQLARMATLAVQRGDGSAPTVTDAWHMGHTQLDSGQLVPFGVGQAARASPLGSCVETRVS